MRSPIGKQAKLEPKSKSPEDPNLCLRPSLCLLLASMRAGNGEHGPSAVADTGCVGHSEHEARGLGTNTGN